MKIHKYNERFIAYIKKLHKKNKLKKKKKKLLFQFILFI